MASALKKAVHLKKVLNPLKKMGSGHHHRSIQPLSDDAEIIESDYRRATSGYMAVRVGPQRYRFIMPIRYLNYPVFVPLLKMAEEQLGFQTSGELVLPCEAMFFKEALKLLHKDEKKFGKMRMDEFMKYILADQQQRLLEDPPCCSRQQTRTDTSSSLTSLLKAAVCSSHRLRCRYRPKFRCFGKRKYSISDRYSSQFFLF